MIAGAEELFHGSVKALTLKLKKISFVILLQW